MFPEVIVGNLGIEFVELRIEGEVNVGAGTEVVGQIGRHAVGPVLRELVDQGDHGSLGVIIGRVEVVEVNVKLGKDIG